MKQTELVSGFSELKDLLVRTYDMKEDRPSIRLYFSVSSSELRLHDFANHRKYVVLARELGLKRIRADLSGSAKRLIEHALSEKSPAEFLNREFLLHGFFKF